MNIIVQIQTVTYMCPYSPLRVHTHSNLILPQFQIISYSNFLRELKHLKFDQNYRKNYKDLWHHIGML
jgi:hypothetical protein